MIVIICCLSWRQVSAFENVTLVPFVEAEDRLLTKCDDYIKNGKLAYRIGLFSLSQTLFQQALNCDSITEEEHCSALLGLSSAYLGNGDWSRLAVLSHDLIDVTEKCHDDVIKNRLRLHAVITSAFSGDWKKCIKIFSQIDDFQLLSSERCWMLAMKSIIAVINGDINNMLMMQEEALMAASSSRQSAQIQAFIMQFVMQLSSKYDTSALIDQSMSLCKVYRLQRNGYPFVRICALLLKQAGRADEAKYLLKQQLEVLPEDDVQSLLSFKLYHAIVHGMHTSDGYALLSEILRANIKNETKFLALKMFLSTAENNVQRMAAYECLSKETVETTSRSVFHHVLLAMFKLAVDSDDLVAAERVIHNMENTFSDKPLQKDMYKILAYCVWMRDVKDYRLIVHYLDQARQYACSIDGEEACLMSQIGSAFYLSGAYELAKHAYIDVLHTKVHAIDYEKILCQLIQCDIKLLDFDSAENHLSFFEKKHESYGDYRWQAELLYINTRLNNGQQNVAMRHLDKLLEKYYGKISVFYAMKFYLLQASSLFLAHDYNNAYIVASNICEILPDNNGIDEMSLIVSQALFIKGACELFNDKEHVARLTYNKLRSLYENSESAMLSYFTEADYYYNHDDFVLVHDLLMECAKSGSKYSPFAYYQLASYCRTKGVSYSEQAISSLSDLISQYDGHEIIFAAKLLLADILRENGRFSDAEVIYDSLLKDYPMDVRSNFVALCLAKSVFAQRDNGEIFIERARMILERLHSTNGLSRDLKIEIDAMYCFVLYNIRCYDQMKNIAWGTLLESLADFESLTDNNIYWLLQITNLLRKTNVSVEENRVEDDALNEIVEKLLSVKADGSI